MRIIYGVSSLCGPPLPTPCSQLVCAPVLSVWIQYGSFNVRCGPCNMEACLSSPSTLSGGEITWKRDFFSAGDPRLPKGGPGRPKGGPGRPPELQKPPKMETKGKQKGDKSEAVAGGEALWIHKYVYIDRPNAEPRDGFRFCSERSPLSAQARLPVLLNIASLPLIRYGCDNNVI